MSLELKPIKLFESANGPVIISGPCSAETKDQILDTAARLKDNGVSILRAGLWKPRTKPGGFEGVGSLGVGWMLEAREKYGMAISTEVANVEHVKVCLEAGFDMLWIGARTSANPFAMQQIADALKGYDIPVLVKNPVSPDLELWIGAVQRLNKAGIQQLGVIHRGFSSYGNNVYRNPPQWDIPIELRRRYPNLPIICDPSHMGGTRDLIAPLSQEAMDLGFEGLIVECHNCPENAWSDAKQQLTPEDFRKVLDSLVIRGKDAPSESLALLRSDLNQCDNRIIELLNERMRLSREIGQLKKQHGMSVLQSDKYGELLQLAAEKAASNGLSVEFMTKIYQTIHEESVNQQLQIYSK